MTKDELFNYATPVTESGCWIWDKSWRTNGYGISPSHWPSKTAHRAVWILLYGEIDKAIDVCHKCDVRPCINPDHLFIGTRSENMFDCSKKGRLGMQVSAELRKAHSLKLTGRTASNETRIKMGKSRKANWENEAYRKKVTASRTGLKRSDETKKRMSIAQRKRYGKPLD